MFIHHFPKILQALNLELMDIILQQKEILQLWLIEAIMMEPIT